MGYSIDSTDTLSSTLRISRTNFLKWKERDLPEMNPIENLSLEDFPLVKCSNGHEQEGVKPFCSDCGETISGLDDSSAALERFSWGGVASSHHYSDGTLAQLAADLEGEADIIFTWEGGDSFSGVRIKDGKAVKHEVQMTLGKVLKER